MTTAQMPLLNRTFLCNVNRIKPNTASCITNLTLLHIHSLFQEEVVFIRTSAFRQVLLLFLLVQYSKLSPNICNQCFVCYTDDLLDITPYGNFVVDFILPSNAMLQKTLLVRGSLTPLKI